jgi:hypothetical protein
MIEARHSTYVFYKMLSDDKTNDINKSLMAPMLKWVDVADAFLNNDEKLALTDLEMIIIEPMKMLADACSARLNKTIESPAMEKIIAATDVFKRKKAYVEYINELFVSLETITGTRYPRIKEA